ncbi:acetate--CoA ligase family protein [Candidimonas nitroreducens]|uniref:acetate--CoA ligase family protein n=1 Tax=Candidimonas nitroreducens TaxID=683354 RepID=UPI001303D2C5|nr:acetate--CoA ligase family protein [Candidimonas nitroreducens]
MESLSSLFAPRAVALVGASQDTNKIRGRLLKLLLDGGYSGKVYPVNPSSKQIQGLAAYPSVDALPEPVDLALIAVAADQVMDVLEQCARRGVKAAAIFSAGGHAPVGERLQDHVAAFAARSGIRILGPNAEGYLDADARVVATFSPTLEVVPLPAPGTVERRHGVSIVSQSGASAYALYSRARALHIPIRHLVSTGNEADVELLEVVDYLITLGTSRAIMLFVEGFRNPERLAGVAQRALAAGIVLLVAKIGRSGAGQRAAVSHTAHLTGADTAYDAAFERYGLLRADRPEQMLALAAAVSAGMEPAGRKVGIITTSGGAGGWAADICEAEGLEVPPLEPAFKQQLATIVPDYGSSENPVDVTARVVEDGGQTLMNILELVSAADGIDIGLIIVSMVTSNRVRDVAERLAPMLQARRRPLVFHSPGEPAAEGMQLLSEIGGLHMQLGDFAYAMRRLCEHREFVERWRRAGAASGSAARDAAAAPRIALDAAAGSLDPAQTRALLSAYGVSMAEEAVVATPQEARAAAARIGFPVALKIVSPDVPHKTEAGGVALGLADEAQVAAAYDRIMQNVRRHAPQARIEGIQVQRMMTQGREMVVGVVNDADFGPMVMLGFGGIYVEVLRDVVFALAPLDLAGAHAMIERLQGVDILRGARGQAPADLDALARFLVAVSELAAAYPRQIAEIDLNPVMLFERGGGVCAVDALVVAAAPAAAGSRHEDAAVAKAE